MEKKKYNFRLAKSDGVQTSIQLQSLDDNKFLRNLLEVNSSGYTQQDSGSNSSSSELNCIVVWWIRIAMMRVLTRVHLIGLQWLAPALLLTKHPMLILRVLSIKLFCSN